MAHTLQILSKHLPDPLQISVANKPTSPYPQTRGSHIEPIDFIGKIAPVAFIIIASFWRALPTTTLFFWQPLPQV
jgi:hypothetical protein